MTPDQIRAIEAARGRSSSPSQIERVADIVGPELARWAFQQWSLRARAAAKFRRADDMLFVPEALEQATHEAVAAYRASRFPSGAAAGDLTCSIGGDLIALARRGPAVGFDLDLERLECARHNLSVYEARAELRLEDCLQAEWPFEYAIADPARREGGRRSRNPSSFAPDPLLLAGRMAGLALGAIKLSPMLDDSYLDGLGESVEFWSFGGECREATIWTGREAEPGRWSVHLESGDRLPAGEPPPSGSADAWFFEADPAAIRGHGLAELCERHRLLALGDSNGYLAGPTRAVSPWLRAYRTLADHPADLKRTRAALRDLGGGRPIVKCRAKGQDPVRLAAELRTPGSVSPIVAVYPVGRSVRHAVIVPAENP